MMSTREMELVVRWEEGQRVRWCLANNSMQPSWKHFVPQLGRFRNGICCDPETHSRWRAPGRKVGLVFDLLRLPAGLKWFALDGNAVHTLSDTLTWAPTPQHFQELAVEAQRNPARYTSMTDEVFIAGRLPVLTSTLVGIVVVLRDGERLGPKLACEIAVYAASNSIPVFVQGVVDEPLRAVAETRQVVSVEQVLGDLDGYRPAVSALSVKTSRAPLFATT